MQFYERNPHTNHKQMKRNIILVVSVLFSLSTLAQQGIIRGKVIDKGNGEELIGATIYLEGTTNGTITDFDGYYALQNLEAGTYNIRCSFISYETMNINNIEVKDEEVLVLDFQLGSASLGLEEVTVEARKIKRTENALLIMQKRSATVMDGISAQQITRMGDNDAASSLKRVTGISVQDGKYIYVRGLSDRYSKTLLNGAEIPGLDPDKNTVQMDLFPSNLLENIIVHKTFSPELPGNFTGGLVNIVTKDFPEKYTFQFSTTLGFNPQVNLIDNFLLYEGSNTDWLGKDDGSRDIPVDLDKIPYYGEDYDKLDEASKSFNKQMEPVEQNSFINHSHSISVGNQIDLNGKPFGFIAGLSYSRDYSYYEGGAKALYQQLAYDANSLNLEHRYSDRKGTEDVLLGGMLSGSYKYSKNSKIGLTLVRNQGGSSTGRYLKGSKPSDDPDLIVESRVLKYVERSFNSAQLQGEHHLPGFKNLEIKWLSSFTYSRQDEPDLRFFTNSYYPNKNEHYQYSVQSSLYKLPARYYRDMFETNYDNKVYFTFPFKMLGAPSKFKFGFADVYKYRDFNDNRVDYSFQFSQDQYNNNISEFLSDDYIGQNAMNVLGTSSYGLYVKDASEEKNNYIGTQNIFASYMMVDMPLAEKLRFIAGARIESTSLFVESDDEGKDIGKLTNLDILPALNLTYALTDKMNLRTALSRTLARPTFRELAPFASEDFAGGEVKVGNPKLERTLIDNLDFRWEYFIKSGDLVSLSAFYKKFTNPIEVVDNPVAVNAELTWQNVDEAQVKGIEAEFRKGLDFIPSMENFKISANITLVESSVSIDSIELAGLTDDAPKSRVMFGQAPYIFNGMFSYENDSIGLSANIAYNVAGEKMTIATKGSNPNIFEQARAQLDFKLSKTLGEHFTLSISAKNLLDTDYSQIYRLGETEYDYIRFSTGRRFSIGIKYLIK